MQLNLNTNFLAEALKKTLENARLVKSVVLWKDDDINAAVKAMTSQSLSNLFIFPREIQVENILQGGLCIKSLIKRQFTLALSATSKSVMQTGNNEVLNNSLDHLCALLHGRCLDEKGKGIILINSCTQCALDQVSNPGRHSWLVDITLQSL